MPGNLLLFISALIAVWIGAGMIVTSLDRIAKHLEISAFAASFFFLGLLTSLPEMSVGVSSILENTPEIFVGDLVGGSMIIFFVVIPLLSVLGNGVKLSHQLTRRKLIFALYLIGLPTLLIIDNNLTSIEGLVLIFMYIILFYKMEKKKGLLDHFRDKLASDRGVTTISVIKIVLGAFIVLMASSMLVNSTIYFSQVLNISPYLFSLLGLSIGTNLPEISIAIRSVKYGKKDIALGDYLGSASANSLLLGILAIVNGRTITFNNHLPVTFMLMTLGLFFFYRFTRSKNDISRLEGILLFLVYLTFFVLEMK
ncbi:MAG: calcium:sodium antiporter, inner membrane protein [Candidatus Gottesmanbacteria bacterium GW2011_GWA2_43_14]|uniref:Calcium:sodium antiporter, inner membrane protein n=1 Tax=Candidatus Gottesmanbacteria bacterium GW2011_GWA2_43_14 TaxID=1618443 RepID=A0A0G1DII2_9BACT|nr:MAG: calcium:sodium antiporter, inner membrane protein [Candidatus Gottesmanbacteria bacterium GW2011_GWA2_43_14]